MSGTEPVEGRSAVVLVDGEHYPPVVRAAIAELAATGVRAQAAVVLGGTEKVAGHGSHVDLGVPAVWAAVGEDVAGTAAKIAALCEQYGTRVVYDLSDEPVLDARRRMRLAAYLLHRGLSHVGADFRFDPPARPKIASRPSIAVIGTGKRTGKTAVCGDLVRRLAASGRQPVVVAMGRGGPPDPVIVEAGSVTGPETLLAVADAGGHAASDFYEDALTTGVATVGARRCGGGLAGGVAHSNVASAVRAADGLAGDLTVIEGSGASIPPVHADASVLVVPGDADPELVAGYLGSYRVLLADLVVVTMASSPRSKPPQVRAVLEVIRSISRTTPLLRTVFRPVPLGEITGAKVFLATTAPDAVGRSLVASLERRFGCQVIATSGHLADRPKLQAELEAAGAFDVLLVECKAAAVDVAMRTARRLGARVVFCDHRPVPATDDDLLETEAAESRLTEEFTRVADLAAQRFAAV